MTSLKLLEVKVYRYVIQWTKKNKKEIFLELMLLDLKNSLIPLTPSSSTSEAENCCNKNLEAGSYKISNHLSA